MLLWFRKQGPDKTPHLPSGWVEGICVKCEAAKPLSLLGVGDRGLWLCASCETHEAKARGITSSEAKLHEAPGAAVPIEQQSSAPHSTPPITQEQAEELFRRQIQYRNASEAKLNEASYLLCTVVRPDDRESEPYMTCLEFSCRNEAHDHPVGSGACPNCGEPMTLVTREQQIRFNREVNENQRQKLAAVDDVDWPDRLALCTQCEKTFAGDYSRCPHCTTALMTLTRPEILKIVSTPIAP